MNKDPEFIEFMSEEEEMEELQNTLVNNAREQGLEQGSKNEKIEITKNMLNKGTDIKYISEVTNLSEEEIEKLIK